MNDIVTVEGLTAYIDHITGFTMLKLEDCAKGLGLTQTSTVKGKTYTRIRWERLREDLRQINVAPTLGQNPPRAAVTNDEIKESFISEPEFYLLAMKVNTQPALNFRNKLAFDILPKIRQQGFYIAQKRKDELLELCDKEYQAALPAYHEFANSVKSLIEYALTHGADRRDIDPYYYKAINARVNRVLGIDNGLRPFANPTTSVHCANINKLIKRTIRNGINAATHFAILFADVLDAIDRYGDDNIDPDERNRNNSFAHARKDDRRRKRGCKMIKIENALDRVLDAARHNDPDYDFEED